MRFNIPKDSSRFLWTNHVVGKMKQYGLSEQKVRSVIFNHKRKEEGIAPKTIAVMQPTGSKKKPTEIWVMYQLVKEKARGDVKNGAVLSTETKKRIITAWRYPGVSPKRQSVPIPDDILNELDSIV